MDRLTPPPLAIPVESRTVSVSSRCVLRYDVFYVQDGSTTSVLRDPFVESAVWHTVAVIEQYEIIRRSKLVNYFLNAIYDRSRSDGISWIPMWPRPPYFECRGNCRPPVKRRRASSESRRTGPQFHSQFRDETITPAFLCELHPGFFYYRISRNTQACEAMPTGYRPSTGSS